MELVGLRPEYDKVMAEIVRSCLKEYGLDIPGTAYFDESLERLSAYYAQPGRAYYVLLQDGKVVGGIGLAEFEGDCCELQKLYLIPEARGNGTGRALVRFIEDRARELGYRAIYLETHSNLAGALRLYEKAGYRLIERPAGVVHGTMDRFFLKDLSGTGTDGKLP